MISKYLTVFFSCINIYLVSPLQEWAGQVEISALSLMYKRDFIIYQDPGKPPSNVTQNGYPNKVLLCFSNNNHYDSVFTKQYQNSLGVCQSIVYEILYKRVFNIAKEADEAVEVLRNSPGKKPHSRHYGYSDHGPNAGGDSLNQRSPRRHEDEERDRFGRLRIEKRRPPLPYKVAKALDPDMYRNVEYDCWNAGNKEQVHQDYLLATGLQFCPGDKVQVVIDDSKKWYSAHIQEVKPDKGPITVFVEDLGEKRDFIIYQDPGKPPSNVTQNGYPNKVLLCFSNNNHYDSVFTKQYQNSLGVCQSIVYEILYKRVFNIAKEADEAVEVLRNSPGKKPHSRHYGYSDHGPNAGGDSLNQRSPRRHECLTN
nr:putative bifunctional UDP-N-acetylglucosamine transferase and deubiquitinase ALG13 [Lytechinus pictus]